MAPSRKKRFFWVVVGLVLVASFTVAILGGIAYFVQRQGSPASARHTDPSSGVLSIGLQGALAENPSPGFQLAFSSDPPPSFPDIIRALDRAAADASLKKVVVRVGATGLEWARARELRDAIGRMRAKGKTVTAVLEDSGNLEYYVASAANEVVALPESILFIHDLSSEVMFFRGMLDKLGVEAQFVSVGKYKNAPNQFTERKFTKAHREQMESLMGSLHREYVSAVAKSRNLKEAEVQERISGGPYDGLGAQEAGLVDRVDYPHDVLEAAGSTRRYLRDFRDRRGAFDTRARIALIFVDGEILGGESQEEGLGSGSVAGSDTVSQALRDAASDATVKAVVLRVNSPGGSGSASDVIAEEVRNTVREKPVVVSMGDYAASGGYYVSAPASAIVADPNTITGSIGVFFGKFVIGGLLGKLGISHDYVDFGRGSTLTSASRPWTSEDLAKVESLASGFYDRFLALVAENRKMDVDAVHAIAQGRVWSGAEAKEIGLVDELGGFERALELARSKAMIPATEDVAVVVFPARKSAFDRLFEEANGWDGIAAQQRLSPAALAALLRERLVRQPAGIWARLPYAAQVR